MVGVGEMLGVAVMVGVGVTVGWPVLVGVVVGEAVGVMVLTPTNGLRADQSRGAMTKLLQWAYM